MPHLVVTEPGLIQETLVRHFVYTIGLANQPPPAEWWLHWEHHRTEMWFPKTKRPAAISAGDRALIYGSQAKGFLAAVEVVGHEPEENQDEDGKVRFPYVMRHRLLVAKLADNNVASPEAAGMASRRIQRGPHTSIESDEYERGVNVLLEAAARSALT